MDQQFYAALYEAEWQRRDQLQSSLSTPLGILVLVGTALTVLLQQFKSNSHILNVVFWPLFVGACAALAVAAYMVVRSFHGYVYSRIPLPSQIRDYHEGLRAHYVAAGYPGLADKEFQLYLLNRYVEAADRNSVHNVNRGEYLHKANRALVAALVATALSAVPYGIAVRSVQPEPQKVEIVRIAGVSNDGGRTGRSPAPIGKRDSTQAAPAAKHRSSNGAGTPARRR